MVRQRTLLTAEEFFWQYSHLDGRYELVKGRVIELAPTGGVHGGVATRINIPLGSFVLQNDLEEVLLETGYRIEHQPDTVRGPDISLVRKERLPEGGLPRAFFEIAPDLAVEVISPSNTPARMEAKVHEYLRNGTQRVWVAYPDSRRVAVHRPGGSAQWYAGDADLEDPELLPGFSLPLPVIFDL
jgi:Uma2 family endonuclease